MPLFFGISQKEKMFFAQHLALMIKGGVPLPEALEILMAETKSKVFQKILKDILEKIREGKKLSKSLSLYPQIFSTFLQNLVKVGEESGTLAENLDQAAKQMRKDFFLREKVKGAMIYPLILAIIGVIIVFGASFFIMPKLGEYFKSLNISLPFFTQILVSFAYFFRENWQFLLAGFFSLILIFKILLKVKPIRFYFHNLSLSLPVIGEILKNLYLSRISRSFYTLLRSGVPILETFNLCIGVIANEVYRRNLALAKNKVAEGEKLNEAFKRFPKAFPPIFIGLVLAGEKSGALEESLFSLAQFFERETDTALRSLPRLIEPILLVLIGFFVLFLGLSIVIPIYRFIGQLGIR